MKYLFLLTVITVAFSSCCIEGKIEATRGALNEVKSQQSAENNRIGGVHTLARTKRAEGYIDSVIENRIEDKIRKYRNSNVPIVFTVSSIDSLLLNKKGFRKKYKSYILPSLDSMKQHGLGYAARNKLYTMVEDALNLSKYQLFDLAAFFGPGRYNIPDDKAALAQLSFAPIIDSVIAFSNKYNVPSTASLVILGFADGTGFSNEGPLFDTLTTLIGRRDVSKEELNQKLSELRATELIGHLRKIYDEKAPSISTKERASVEYVRLGKGEAYPLPTIKDYTIDDPRRRIVLCYWIVLPD